MWYLKIQERILKLKHLFTGVDKKCSDKSQEEFFLLREDEGKPKSWKDRVWTVAGDGAHIAVLKVYQTLNLSEQGYSAEAGGWEKGK